MVVNTAFGLGVSFRSSDYITKVNLRTYGLALVDDDEEIGLTSMVSVLIIAMPPELIDKTTAIPVPAPTETTYISRGNPPHIQGFGSELSCCCLCLTCHTLS